MISIKLHMMPVVAKLYSVAPVSNTLIFTQGHRVIKKKRKKKRPELEQSFRCKVALRIPNVCDD